MKPILKVLRFMRRHSGKAGKHKRMSHLGMAIKRMKRHRKY